MNHWLKRQQDVVDLLHKVIDLQRARLLVQQKDEWVREAKELLDKLSEK